MLNDDSYRKMATLSMGKRVMIRFLNSHDRDRLINFFQQAPTEDIEFCRHDLKNPEVVDHWLGLENFLRMMSLVASDIGTDQIVASLNIYIGQQAVQNVGDIHQIIVARPYQGSGLGSLMLDELINIALRERLHWLKVEIAIELKNVLKAFKSKGFEIKAVLEDYFRDRKGKTHDVALMMLPLLMRDCEDF
jgi:ribosomal protein S18 acetylase RimI-like enzyme